eukprot:940119-Prymnesium_polylepis.1
MPPPPTLLPVPPPLTVPPQGARRLGDRVDPLSTQLPEDITSPHQVRSLRPREVTLQVMYSEVGGRTYADVLGNILREPLLKHIQNVESELRRIEGYERFLRKPADSLVPCLFGVRAADSFLPDESSPSADVEGCLTYVAQQSSPLSSRLGSELEFQLGDTSTPSCPALQTHFFFSDDGDGDFVQFEDRLIHFLHSADGKAGVEISFYGYPMIKREVYLAVIKDAQLVVISILFIFIFTAAVLRLPLLASLSLIVVLAAFPVGYALYVGPFGVTKLPALAVISLYLTLGIGIDAIFVLCNTYALSQLEQTSAGMVVEVQMSSFTDAERAAEHQSSGPVAHATPAESFRFDASRPASPVRALGASALTGHRCRGISPRSSSAVDERDNHPLVSATARSDRSLRDQEVHVL